MSQLRAAEIFAHVHYIPIHLQPYYQNLGFSQRDFPNAERYYEQAITLPLFPELSLNDLTYIVDTITKYVDNIYSR